MRSYEPSSLLAKRAIPRIPARLSSCVPSRYYLLNPQTPPAKATVLATISLEIPKTHASQGISSFCQDPVTFSPYLICMIQSVNQLSPRIGLVSLLRISGSQSYLAPGDEKRRDAEVSLSVSIHCYTCLDISDAGK